MLINPSIKEHQLDTNQLRHQLGMNQRGKERATVRVEVTKKELGRNLNKLDHCVVGTWNPSATKGDDLRDWGIQLAKIWSLKGILGLAKMERGKVLMEFELLT